MKNTVLLVGCLILTLSACTDDEGNRGDDGGPIEVTQEFKDYWFQGEAEISSYKLQQMRYGEMREGTAVLVYVTEPFSIKKRTKPNENGTSHPSVLKLNFTKNFNTGIYPYSVMTSIFQPVDQHGGVFKLSCGIQEWCGQVYMEMNREKKCEIDIHSYFEDETKSVSLESEWFEDEIWTLIRLDPSKLPIGEVQMVPTFSYLRLMHKEIQPYVCQTEFSEGDTSSMYHINFPELDRSSAIEFQSEFPHKIYSWSENYPCSGCQPADSLRSSAVLMKSIRSDYWNQNSLKDSLSRNDLLLP